MSDETQDVQPEGEREVPKLLDLDDFQNIGYLQEVNRQFFHPLGLALMVETDKETGKVIGIPGIWDMREDPEGIIFGDNQDPVKCAAVFEIAMRRKPMRELILGYFIEPPRKLPDVSS